MNWKYRNFDPKEFESPDIEGSGYNMQAGFMEMLQHARKIANIPFVITSGYRSEAHNKAVGGVANSSHLKGLAADIRVRNGIERLTILSALLQAGFRRIGIGESFIHVDLDSDKPASVWTYYK